MTPYRWHLSQVEFHRERAEELEPSAIEAFQFQPKAEPCRGRRVTARMLRALARVHGGEPVRQAAAAEGCTIAALYRALKRHAKPGVTGL